MSGTRRNAWEKGRSEPIPANFLRFSNPFSGLFGGSGDKSGNSIIAIDFGSSGAKVIQLRRDKGRIVLETYGEIATGPYVGMSVGQAVNLGLDKMTEVVTDLLRESNVTSKNAAIAIPLRSSLLMVLDIPTLSKNDLATAVPTEARRFIPVPISEVYLDWWIIPEREDISPAYEEKTPDKKMQEVLIAAIHRDTVGLYQNLAQKLALSSNTYEIETFSLIRSAMQNDLSATAIIDLGAGTTKMAIVDYGVVRVSHTINKGAQDISVALSKSLSISFEKAEEIKRKVGLVEEITSEGDIREVVSPVVEYIFEEVNRVIVAYQKKHTVAVEKVILVGGGSQLRGILDLAKKSLQMNVVIGSPFDKMETPAFLDKVLAVAGPSFAVTIGLALRKLEELG
ncbi:MAG: type IV pilus assembly protein PilM [Candidatus Vogelbacteria bacterium]|nr:type IV pilus assembly protein PilM [Candidatus Vogelbacteria bacterium]